MAKIPGPQYSAEQAISVALALATRALDEVRALSRQPGPQGAKGERGEPGLSSKDFEYDGERRLTLKRDEDKVVCILPILIDRGVWKPEQKYERGDTVTWGGSLWIAQADSTANKPGLSKDWRLAVKRGRDGKDGDRGPQGNAGPSGKDGRDLTQMGPDGQKW